MKIEFQAVLEGNGCIRYDGDGACVVRLTVPANEIANVVKLLMYREKLLRILIDPGAGK
jgi:hypothetical protein